MRSNGFEVSRMKSRKATLIRPCTASALALSVARQRAAEKGDEAPKIARISTQSSIEPSWFPQTPEIL